MSLLDAIKGILPVTHKELMAAFDELKQTIADEKAQSVAKLQELADKIAALEGQVITSDQVAELKSDISGIIPDAA